MVVNKQDENWNFSLFLETVNTLKTSQGFYSRLAQDLANMDDEQKEKLKNYLNNQPKFNDSVDVVLFLEQ